MCKVIPAIMFLGSVCVKDEGNSRTIKIKWAMHAYRCFQTFSHACNVYVFVTEQLLHVCRSTVYVSVILKCLCKIVMVATMICCLFLPQDYYM